MLTKSRKPHSLYNEQGKTFAFDDRAVSGFACGEGLGCVVLKPLDQALEDNDPIYSVIRSTGLNHDGRTVGELPRPRKAITRILPEWPAKHC